MDRMSLFENDELVGVGHGELVLVGLGLWDNGGISLSGVEAASAADEVYAELYTSLMPDLDIMSLQRTLGKRISVLSRRDLEDDADEKILKLAQNKRVVLLVPGDPLAATTHISLRLRASELKIKTRIIHAASVFSAAASLAGLQHYKFGKTVTIPIRQEGYMPLSPYDVLSDNLSRGLHTLFLLDLDVEQSRFLSISQALNQLQEMEHARGMKVITENRLAIGLARIGSLEPIVRCNRIKDLVGVDFGVPPHSLIVPGRLHFMEANVLVKLHGAPSSILSTDAEDTLCQDF
jgi:diphthine synthase